MTAENRQIRLPETKKEPAFTVSYTLMREARRTLAAKLTEEGLVVKSPLRMALADIEAFLIKNTRWIRKHLAAQKARQDVASLAQLRHGGRFFYRGCMTGLMLGAERTALIERCGQQILCLSRGPRCKSRGNPRASAGVACRTGSAPFFGARDEQSRSVRANSVRREAF
ncbi:MAG: YgjP-like metallopeptidase domain-containing protein [Duodenibacillus massiliensis]